MDKLISFIVLVLVLGVDSVSDGFVVVLLVCVLDVVCVE